MSYQSQLSSDTFTIDNTSDHIYLDKHFYKASTQIIKQGHPRKVIFGQMEQEERSVYEIVSPYVASMAKTTGNIALEAGSIAYGYLKQGFWWFYDQITNKVIPYTREQIPKLIFIVAKSAKGQKAIKSGEFCVLQMQDDDYKEIAKKQRQQQGPIKVLIPLGEKDQALIEEIKKNYEVSYSFPVEDLSSDSQNMSITYCIPSESYEILQNEARVTRSRAIDITELQEKKSQEKKEVPKNEYKEKVEEKPEDLLKEKLQKAKVSQDEEWQEVKLSSIRGKSAAKQTSKPKAIFLPDACCFIYEQQNQLYPMIKDGLERDANAVVGHLISSDQYKRRQSRDSSEGKVPLITIDQKIGKNIEIKQQVEIHETVQEKKRAVDTERKVRPEIEKNVVVNEVKKIKQV